MQLLNLILMLLIIFFAISFHLKLRIYLKRLARFEKRITKLEIINREKLLKLAGFTPINKEKQKERLKHLVKSIH